MNYRKLVFFMVMASTLLIAGCRDHRNDMATNPRGEITVVSRETGSGTRDAFIEQANLLYQDQAKKIDQTTLEAIIQNSTAGVLSTVAGDNRAIGYVSLGTLTAVVQAATIDGVEATTESILAGDYVLQRPFVICWPQEVREIVKDFIHFTQSKEGQAIVVQAGYVPTNPDASAYQSTTEQQGLVTIVGSTSVTPVMEKLAEYYQQLHPEVQIDIISNGSTAGITAIEEGTADIGMSSRQLKAEEAQQMNAISLALDGIVVVVNKQNPITDFSLEEVTQIFNGTITDWQELAKD